MAVQTYDDFDLASADLGKQAEEMMVCGTLVNDQPKYFLAPKDTPDDKVRDKAFEVREGRPPTGYERFLLEQAATERERLSA